MQVVCVNGGTGFFYLQVFLGLFFSYFSHLCTIRCVPYEGFLGLWWDLLLGGNTAHHISLRYYSQMLSRALIVSGCRKPCQGRRQRKQSGTRQNPGTENFSSRHSLQSMFKINLSFDIRIFP